jgi:hypothetical protein
LCSIIIIIVIQENFGKHSIPISYGLIISLFFIKSQILFLAVEDDVSGVDKIDCFLKEDMFLIIVVFSGNEELLDILFILKTLFIFLYEENACFPKSKTFISFDVIKNKYHNFLINNLKP